jgi:hypothetical protein
MKIIESLITDIITLTFRSMQRFPWRNIPDSRFWN